MDNPKYFWEHSGISIWCNENGQMHRENAPAFISLTGLRWYNENVRWHECELRVMFNHTRDVIAACEEIASAIGSFAAKEPTSE